MHALESSSVVIHALESLDIDIEIISRMIVAYFFILMYAIREILGF